VHWCSDDGLSVLQRSRRRSNTEFVWFLMGGFQLIAAYSFRQKMSTPSRESYLTTARSWGRSYKREGSDGSKLAISGWE
jgi:hypothetical protein